MNQPAKAQEMLKPKKPQKIKQAVALGKKLSKTPDTTKASMALQMFELIHEESREIIAKVFMDGANLTEKGATTYFYNCL